MKNEEWGNEEWGNTEWGNEEWGRKNERTGNGKWQMRNGECLK